MLRDLKLLAAAEAEKERAKMQAADALTTLQCNFIVSEKP